MEELTGKIDQVLAGVAAAAPSAASSAAASASPSHPIASAAAAAAASAAPALPGGGGARQRGSKFALVRLKDGTQEPIELTPDLRLGIGDDTERLAEQLRLLRGLDVEAVELPKPPNYKETLQWAETLSQAFAKAWMQRVDLVDFVEAACRCGEGLISHRQHSLAYLEVYNRFSDRALALREKLEPGKVADENYAKRAIAAVVRFKLGRTTVLYQQTIRKDEGAKRRDTVESLRDVLRDILAGVKFVNSFEVSIREELYWTVYNSCVLALRVSRWLRLHGFGGVCVPSLGWLAKSANSSLPMMAVHFVPMRVRFLAELVYCAEAAMQLGEASRLCDSALEQLEKDKQLETMIQPVPEETTQVFDTALMRFRVLKLKYDFWLDKIPDAKQVAVQAEALGPSWTVPCLLEAFELQHGLPTHFGSSAPKDLETGAASATGGDGGDGASELTKLSLETIRSKQRDLLAAIVERAQPHLDKAEAAAKVLEEFTAKRLAFEAEEERRARSGELPSTAALAATGAAGEGEAAAAGEDGEAPAEEPLKAPDRPSQEQLDELGFKAEGAMHSVEEVLPLAAHMALARECLRREFLAGGGADVELEGGFAKFERLLALRLRYRHFLNPPIVDIDVIVSAQRSRDKVRLPDKYDFLTEDLNAHSLRNRQLEAEAGAATATQAAPTSPTKQAAGKHVYVIGRRFDAWESWTSQGPARIRRLCNLRVAFGRQPPNMQASAATSKKGTAAAAGAAGAGGGAGPADGAPMASADRDLKPWSAPYSSASADDSAGFDHLEQTGQIRDGLLGQLSRDGHLRPGNLALPIEAHPGANAKEDVQAFLTYSVYEEAKLWTCDEEVHKEATLSASMQPTLLPAEIGENGDEGEAAAAEGDGEGEQDPPLFADDLLPPLCPLLDTAASSASAVVDLSIFSTKHLHAPARGPEGPSNRFNAMIRTDLRQTPGELLGRPFQSYIFACAAVEAPSTVFVERQLRVLRAFSAVHVVLAGGTGEGGADVAASWQRPEVVEALRKLGTELERVVSGPCGQLFLLDSADVLEDVCAHAFMKWIWPRLKSIQDIFVQEELSERTISDRERSDISNWSACIRQVLPQLLRVLEEVRSLDASTLGVAAGALGSLFHGSQDARSGQAALGMAISRLEDELAEASIHGPQPRLDSHVSAAVSFDPPSLRHPDHALFDGADGEAAVAGDECTLLLGGRPRGEQDRICLLTRLYATWIDLSLKVHLKNMGSTVRRALQPGEQRQEEFDSALLGIPTSTKVSLSNQEAIVLSRLGENVYLRSLFFVAVARRRPEASYAALGKACEEVEAAVRQEQTLWTYFEAELLRQQRAVRSGTSFVDEFVNSKGHSKAKKEKAHPVMLFGRAPGAIRFRAPPLADGSAPPVLPSSIELSPAEQAFAAEHHSERLDTRSASSTVLTCAVYGKAAGTGTSVSEMHRELPGTGLRRFGYEALEVSGLKPNTNYSFATMYFEGFEANKPAASSISETSPPIGAYYPLPIALLRVEICKQALKGGESCKAALARAWQPLFDGLCERSAPCEEAGAWGLRSFKLRLDVADRMPPAVLSAFAELIMQKNGRYGQPWGKEPPLATRSAQQAALRAANECLVAVDCARRAGIGRLALQGVSLALKLVERLLQLRSRPPVLLGLLAKCAATLEAFDPSEEQVAWHAKARVMTTFLFHQISVVCIQLRQKDALMQTLSADVPRRYSSHPLADSAQQVAAGARLLDQALELALLGGGGGGGDKFWELAESKLQVALRDQGSTPAAAELPALLKDIAQGDFVKVAKEASELVLRPPDDSADGADGDAARRAAERHPLALALLRAAVMRTWDKEESREALAAVLNQHPLGPSLEAALQERRKRFTDFGFLVRAMPLERVQLTAEEAMTQEEAAEAAAAAAEQAAAAAAAAAAAEEGENAAAPAEEEPAEQDLAAEAGAAEAAPKAPSPEELLAGHQDASGLAQLELLKAGPILQEMCRLSFHFQDISRFKFFDLQQVSLPELPADGATLGGTPPPPGGADGTGDEAIDEGAAGEAGEGEEEEGGGWRAKEAENKASKERAFELLKEMLPLLVRAASYASAAKAEQLLQTSLLVALNALLVARPSPAECVPAGAQSNPQDIDPDKFVGAEADGAPGGANGDEGEGGEQQEQEEAEAKPKPWEQGPDVWLNLALLADLAVRTLHRLKSELAPPPRQQPEPLAAAGAAATSKQHRPSAKSGARRGGAVPLSSAASGAGSGPNSQRGSKEEALQRQAEADAIRVAKEASQELGAADEELHEMWFEKRPDLDIGSLAKLVAFAALCLYHMRRWSNVLVLCRSFNEATCSVYATTFLPLMIGAQSQICYLSDRALASTKRYTDSSKTTFEADQKALPRKLLRQLALQGELSVPEKLYKKRSAYYEDLSKRQRMLHGAWDELHKALESSRALVARAVPAAVEQLRKSRILLAEFLQDRQTFLLRLSRNQIFGGEKMSQERALKLAGVALVSSYRKAVELLRKRQMADQVVLALHELGNLQWLEGDASGARTSWSDAVDTAYQHVYAIKNWQKCVETGVTPPKDAARAEIMLLTVVILAKHARLTNSKDTAAHLHAALFASSILEAIVTTSLPHPFHRKHFSLDHYRLREIFLGLRETRLLLPPSSVHGGVDGTVFLGALSFFHNTLLVCGYQMTRCMPICAIYNYIATDVCRSRMYAMRGRLMMARALVRVAALDSAWFVLWSLSKGNDAPRALLDTETLDRTMAELPDTSGATAYTPYRTDEEPFSENNKKAVAELLQFAPPSAADGEGEGGAKMSAFDTGSFQLAQAEFLLTAASFGRAGSAAADPQEVERASWLEKADALLRGLWKELTGNDDDVQAACPTQEPGAASPPEAAELAEPAKQLGEQESELCAEVRVLLAKGWELRGNLSSAVAEVLYAMRFVRLLAKTGVKSAQECNMGGASSAQLRTHPGAKMWLMLRRRMVHLLVLQGRLQAAGSHIEQGLQECQSSNDDITRIELLAAKVRVDALQGRLLELRGTRRSGAIPSALCCAELAAKRLPALPACAVVAKAVLSLLLEQNPCLAELAAGGGEASHSELLAEVLASYGRSDDPNETLILDAQGKVVLSPIATAMLAKSRAEKKDSEDADGALPEALSISSMTAECLKELEKLLASLGFELNPHNLNTFFDIRETDEDSVRRPAASAPADGAGGGEDAGGRRAATPLAPALRPGAEAGAFRKRPASDGREPPNVHLELLPLAVHCELRLARLRLDEASLGEAEALLRNAEARMARCVFLLPWLYVQFCVTKFQWRRLTHLTKVARSSPPPDAPNDLLFRDPKAFAHGRCPPTDSPLFRTFLRRGGAPPLAPEAAWVAEAGAPGEDGFESFLAETVGILKVAAKEGGHDYSQISALLREALEELLRLRCGGPGVFAAPAVATEEGKSSPEDVAFALLSALERCAETKKALHFETAAGAAAAAAPPDPKAKDPKGGAAAGPGLVDCAQLPARVALDLQRHLQRQGFDATGDLAYSAAACQDAQKALPVKALFKHLFSLRRECDTFGSLYHGDRLLCDSLHAALARSSDQYAKAKVLDEASIDALLTPPAAPTSGDLLVHWAKPDDARGPAALGTAGGGAEDPRIALFAFVCADAEAAAAAAAAEEAPSGGGATAAKPMVARCNDVDLASVRRLSDDLAADLRHCQPATAVSAAFLGQRLRSLASILRGGAAVAAAAATSPASPPASPTGRRGQAAAPVDEELEAALSALLASLAVPEAADAGGDGADAAGAGDAESLLDSEKVQELLRAILKLLDIRSTAAKVSHLDLSALLRAVFRPLACQPLPPPSSSASPAPPPPG